MPRSFLPYTFLAAALFAMAPACDKKDDAGATKDKAAPSAKATAAAASTAATPATTATPTPDPAPTAAPAGSVVLDMAPAPASSASAAPLASAVQNAADIGRYPDEAKLDEPSTVKSMVADVHNAASTSKDDIIATLNQGTPVRKVATHADYYLGVYDDPTTPGKALEGWITKAALDNAAPAPQAGAPAPAIAPPPAACGAGTLQFASQAGVLCLKECATHEQCGPGMRCDGHGWRVRDGHARDRGRYCVGKMQDHKDDHRDEHKDEHKDERRDDRRNDPHPLPPPPHH